MQTELITFMCFMILVSCYFALSSIHNFDEVCLKEITISDKIDFLRFLSYVFYLILWSVISTKNKLTGF